MEDLILSLPDDGRPPYLRIAESVRTAIQNGRLKPGERLPSSRVLAEKIGVHRHTVTSAMNELVAEGWLEGKQRSAHKVSSVLPSHFFQPRAVRGSKPRLCKLKWQFSRQADLYFCGSEPNEERQNTFRYRFQSGRPDLRLFPFDEFRACIAESLRRSPAKYTDYADPSGHPYFIERIEEYLGHMRALTGRKILVTHGTQEGLFLTAQLLLQPGDRVAVEALGYHSAWDAFRVAGADLVPVKVDGKGMDPADLEKVVSRNNIKLIYTTPHHQHPTTATLPPTRRQQIYELASRKQIPIFEDDYDHEYHYRCQPISPLASSDPCELVIYTTSLSKTMFPSIRIGVLAVPEPLHRPLASLRTTVTRQNSVFLQEAVARWMDNGGFERHLRRMRRTYLERRDALVEALEAVKDRGLPVSWVVPDGGMGLWLDCGMNTDIVSREAAKRKVYVSPESNYSFGKHRPGTHLRLGFASQTPEEIHAGINVLADAMESSSTLAASA